MRSLPSAKATTPKWRIAIIVVSLLVAAGPFNSQTAYAADLSPRAIKISSSFATQTAVDYEITFNYATAGPVGSLMVMFCQESPLFVSPCTQPAGFDASGATLTSQTGETGFTVFGGSTAHEVILTRPPSVVAAGTNSVYTLSNITNPANDGALYARILTYASSDATGPNTDFGGLALAINPRPTIQAEVPPFLLFCLGESVVGFDCDTATEPFSDVGILGPLVTGAAQSQLVVATNGASGYSMWVIGGTMTSGNNTLPAMAGGPSQQGVSQFGINLRANTDPVVGQNATGPGVATIDAGYNTPNQFRYQSGDSLVTADSPDDFRKFTVSYIVNVADAQPGGVYATTLTYITLANF